MYTWGVKSTSDGCVLLFNMTEEHARYVASQNPYFKAERVSTRIYKPNARGLC